MTKCEQGYFINFNNIALAVLIALWTYMSSAELSSQHHLPQKEQKCVNRNTNEKKSGCQVTHLSLFQLWVLFIYFFFFSVALGKHQNALQFHCKCNGNSIFRIFYVKMKSMRMIPLFWHSDLQYVPLWAGIYLNVFFLIPRLSSLIKILISSTREIYSDCHGLISPCLILDLTWEIARVPGPKSIWKSRWNWPLLEYILIVCITACLKWTSSRRSFALCGQSIVYAQ